MLIERCYNYFRVGTYDLNAVHNSIKADPISYHVFRLICLILIGSHDTCCLTIMGATFQMWLDAVRSDSW